MSRSFGRSSCRAAALSTAVLLAAAVAPVGAAPGVVSPQPAAAAAAGMFKVRCFQSDRAADDPIVYPGKPGAAHLHDFFGNRSTNAYSTLSSLRAAGTNCQNMHDKAAYWAPVLYQDGKAVTPKEVQVYYRASNRDPQAIRNIPAGLKMIAGDPTSTRPQSVDVAGWTCRAGDLPQFQSSMPTCNPAAGDKLRNRIRFPECWDGKHLDSADHRSHLAYLVSGRCPAGHPVALPRVDIEVHYGSIPAGSSRVRLSSGSWTTLHADFFNAWDQDVLGSLIQRCLNGEQICGLV